MKKLLYIFVFLGILSAQAQTDYNTDKGFVAEGYDVVSYFENKAVEGNENYIATYDGANYKFESQNHLDTFNANPKKYVPQYGGYCAWAVADDSKKVSINPKYFEIQDGKLYLFYKTFFSNTKKKWNENDVKGLQKKADQNWELIYEKD